jgi:hypothetical protein
VQGPTANRSLIGTYNHHALVFSTRSLSATVLT